MRVMIIEKNGVKTELPLTTTIEEIEKIAKGSGMNVIEYKEVLECQKD